jgi:carboxypeptidase T
MKRLPFLLILLLPLLLSLSLPRATAATNFGGAVNEVIVIRAYFDDPLMVEYVTSWTAPWEVNYEEGYMVLDVTAEQEQFLASIGYTVVRDDKLSAQYSNPAKPLAGQSVTTIPGYPCYRTVEGTLATIDNLIAQYPTLASKVDIGDSWLKTQNPMSGYDLVVLKLTNSAIPGPKPTIFNMSAVHAREYTTAELNTRLAEYLLTNYGTDADATWLLDHHEFHLLLQANPDGRKRAETGLSWRKNVNNTYCANTNTRGADLNRNFSFQWGGAGSSPTECSDVFRGVSAASEPEVAAIEAYNRTIFADVRPNDLTSPAPITTTGVFVDIHSYSRLVLWPWGFTGVTGNDAAFKSFGRKLAYFNSYTPQQAVALYPTTGTTIDFAYGELGVAAFTFELGNAFFESCSNFENTILPDNLKSLLYMSKAARLPYQLPAGPDVLNLSIPEGTIFLGELITVTAVLDDTRYRQTHGTEPTHNIAGGELYLSTPYWEAGATPIPLTPTDGAFNSKVETAHATFNTADLGPGQHMLFVRGQDVQGNWGVVSAIFIDVTLISPTAAFTPAMPFVINQAGAFINHSTYANSYEWDFGDGSPLSTAVHPTHTYTATGSFSVTLLASNGVLTDTITQPVYVVAVPTAAFTATSPTTLGDVTTFANLSTEADSFVWDFGDGSALSTAVSPTHSYTTTGLFSVTLLASNGWFTDTVSQWVQVVPVEIITPTAVFTLTTPIWLGETAVFTNTSTDAFSYTWDFGDGSPLSTVPSPTHTYTSTGVFTVTLTAHNGPLSHTTSHPITVRPMPQAGYVIHLPLVVRE